MKKKLMIMTLSAACLSTVSVSLLFGNNHLRISAEAVSYSLTWTTENYSGLYNGFVATSENGNKFITGATNALTNPEGYMYLLRSAGSGFYIGGNSKPFQAINSITISYLAEDVGYCKVYGAETSGSYSGEEFNMQNGNTELQTQKYEFTNPENVHCIDIWCAGPTVYIKSVTITYSCE